MALAPLRERRRLWATHRDHSLIAEGGSTNRGPQMRRHPGSPHKLVLVAKGLRSASRSSTRGERAPAHGQGHRHNADVPP